MTDSPQSLSSSPDNLLGENPFPIDHPWHQGWIDTSRWAKEQFVLLESSSMKNFPPESASSKEVLDWFLQRVAGQFDIVARAYSRFCRRTDQGADSFEDLLNELENRIVAHAGRFRLSFIPEQLFLFETRVRLRERKQYYIGQMYKQVREAKEKKADDAPAFDFDGYKEALKLAQETLERSQRAQSNRRSAGDSLSNASESLNATTETLRATIADLGRQNAERFALNQKIQADIHGLFMDVVGGGLKKQRDARPAAEQEAQPAGVPNPAAETGVGQHRGDVIQERAERRCAVVMPILERKRWSRCKWASKAGVGKNCVYEYLTGRRNLTAENATALAQELETENLPE